MPSGPKKAVFREVLTGDDKEQKKKKKKRPIDPSQPSAPATPAAGPSTPGAAAPIRRPTGPLPP
ncbi:hypothetical protein FRC11_001318, partial [Ceratobasidium sp. 423]